MKKRYKFFSWPVFGQKPIGDWTKFGLYCKKTTAMLVIGVLVILAALGIVANSVEVKSDSYKEKKQPTALENFMIAKSPTHLMDGTTVNIALVMVKGEYYDMNYAGPGGGICEENYSGEYELQAYKGDKLLSKLNIGNQIFGNKFDIIFEDYNKDENMDFAIGQWVSSSVNLYTIYTVNEEGIVNCISPVDLIASSERDYSLGFTHDENGIITTEAYNNVIGAYEKKVYFWNDESKMYERQKSDCHIDIENMESNEMEDIELRRRLSTVTPEEMNAAKRVGEDGWETSILLLAEIPDENIFMYGYNDKDYQGKGVIIQIGENTNYFDWNYCSPRMILAEMYYYDYDNDGRKELAVALNLGGGTGVSITDLYVLEKYDTGTLEPFHFRAEDYVAQINERMTYQVDSDKKVIALYDGKNKLREADLTWLPEDARVEGVYYGNIVDFQLGEQLRMKIGPGMEINNWASLQYDGLDDLEAVILYKNGTFRVTTIE